MKIGIAIIVVCVIVIAGLFVRLAHNEKIDSMKDKVQQEPTSADLEEEIEKCLKQHNMLAVGKKDFTDIAKHFANWQKEKMLSNAVDATLLEGNLIRQKGVTHPLHVGDKVKVIVIKEE